MLREGKGEDFGVIYMLENQVNGKQYIGQTVDINRRMSEHRKGDNQVIDKAINKYGYEKFKLIILEDEIPRSKIDTKERQYIEEYDTFEGRGYNYTEGGKAHRIPHATREKISRNQASFSGTNNPQAKVTEKEGKKIKRDYERDEKITMKNLSERFDISYRTVRYIVHGKHWTTQGLATKDITEIKPWAGGKNKLTKKDKEEIRIKYNNKKDITQQDLADEYNISRGYVGNIVRGER